MKKIIVFSVLLLFSLSAFLFLKNVWGTSSYTGTESCKACHETFYEGYGRTPHAKKSIPSSPGNGYGCESCHGPGASHIEKGGGRGTGIFAFGKSVDATEKSSRCLACHEESRHLLLWSAGRHKLSDISCDNCHSIHNPAEKSLKANAPALCFDCHRDIRLQSSKQSRHPIKEGRLNCGDCHNPHGGPGSKMIKTDTVNELCYTCHAEKRGPYRFEHPPVAENCLTCHEPHGSNHTRLLVRKPPYLCQSCHDTDFHPGAPYTSFEGFKGSTPSNIMVSRSCLNCHTNIHGSNGPASDGRRFFR